MNPALQDPRRPELAQRVLVLACMALVSSSAWSLGVGRPQTQSALGQPLNLLFPLNLSPGEGVTLECIRAEVQAGDSQVPASLLHWMLEGDGQRVRAVRLRSAQPIDEPLVSVHLSIGCPAKLTRQYTAFIDPPGSPLDGVADTVDGSMPGYSPALQAALATADAKPSQLLDPASPRPAPTTALPHLAAAPALAPAASAASAAAPKPRPRRAAPRRSPEVDPAAALATAAKPRAPAAPRLSLEPAEALASLVAAEAAASAASAAQQAQAQLQAMERRMAEMQLEQQRTQTTLRELRQELQAARQQAGSGGSNLWLMGLGLLSAALAVSSLMLWRNGRAQRARLEQGWFAESRPDPQVGAAAAPASASTRVATAAVAASAPVQAAGEAPAPAAARDPLGAEPVVSARASALAPPTIPMPLSITDPERTMELPGLDATWPGRSAFSASATAATDDALAVLAQLDAQEPLSVQLMPPQATTPVPLEPTGPVTVEELIDLEQQVDFFLVLGQDDAAIELLSDRLGQRAAASGLPFLKLMELYQRRGDREAFDRVAQRFAQQFNARAPAWSDDISHGAGLESHPELLQRLEKAWPEAAGSMSLLQDLLARRQEYSGELGLPAYRDLLMLYAVARDRSEHEVRGGDIDVFLPLDATAAGQDMMATMVWQAPAQSGGPNSVRGALQQSVDLDLDLDLSLVEPEPDEAPTTKRPPFEF